MTRARLAGGLGALLWLQNVQHILAPSEPVRGAAVLLLVAYLWAAFPSAPAMTRRIAAACAVACAGLVAAGSPAVSAWRGLDFALTFMGFLPAIHLVRLAVERDPRLADVGRRLADGAAGARSDAALMMSHVSGAVLTLGTFAIVGPAFAGVSDPAERRAIAGSTLRGLCLAILWTPFTVGMGFAGANLPGVPLWQAMAVGAVAAATGLAFSLRGRSARSAGDAVAASRPVLLPVAAAALALTLANAATGLSTLHLVMLGMPPLCIAWLAWRQPAGLGRTARAMGGDLGRMGGEMLLFAASISMGFALDANPAFREALSHAGLADLPPVEIMAVMTLAVIVCALAGLHAMVTGTIIVALAAGLDGALSDLAVFTLILFGWSMTAMLSVSSLAVAVTARTFSVPLTRVIYGPNLAFALAMAVGLTLAVGAAEAVAEL